MDDLRTRVSGFAHLNVSWRDIGDGETIDHDALDRFRFILDDIDDRREQPCIVLSGLDLPDDLAARGGWRLRETAERYASYTGAVAARFGDRVDHWVSLASPIATLDQHFRTDGRSLAEAAADGMLDAAHHLLLAHGGAVQVLRAHVPRGQIGPILDVETTIAEPDGDREIEGAWTNVWFPHALAKGGYPAPIVEAFGWDQKAVRTGDERILKRRVDFVSLEASQRAGDLIGRLVDEYGFERFWVLSDR